MTNGQKDLIFYFLEEMDLNSSNEDSFHNQSISLIKKFEEIGSGYNELNTTMNELSDLFINLCASIKTKYFEYGILTASVIENTRVE